jgi:hypothetical protein
MRPLRSLFVLLASALLCSTTPMAQVDASTVRIVNPIDESQLTTIRGTVHPLANARNDRGVAPQRMPLERMHLVLKRSASQESALRQLIGEMHAPGSASYHKWLTPEQFGKQFGPSDEDIATVEAWLTGHGFNAIKLTPGKQTIEFSGNVEQLQAAFHTVIHKYAVNGETHYANAADPQIPAALAPVVGGFVSLNNFRPRSYVKYLGKAQYDPKADKATPEWTTGNSTEGYEYVLAPQDYAVQYDLSPLYAAGTTGAGQTIAIINESNINVASVNNFRSLFGLPANPPQVIIDGNDPGVDGVNDPDGPNGASVEAYLDVEWAGAVAPNATIDLVIGADTALESGLILAAEHAVSTNLAPVMSVSFGQCESSSSTAYFLESLWEQAAAQGITVIVSSGDSGSAGCDNENTEEFASNGLGVNAFASTAYDVAVGGTDFYYSDYSKGLSALKAQIGTFWNNTESNNAPAVSIKGVIPEQPWNDSQYGLTLATLENGSSPTSTSIAAGGGGASNYVPKPAWQSGTGVPNDGERDLPDVSLFASNGVNESYYPICAVDGDCQPVASGETVQFSGVGGTSASAPAFAGVMALVNQIYGRQGQADFVLYPLAQQVPAAFHDVTNGANTVPCAPGYSSCITVANPITITDPANGQSVTEGEMGTETTADYNAAAGYDLASGLGTIDAYQLVTNWGSVKFASTTATLTPSSSSFTHGTQITVSGSVTAASGTPTGNVALMTDSTEPGEQGQGVPSILSGVASTFPLDDGAFSGLIYSLPGGTYNIWGQYGGDAANAPSSSTPVSITVSPESSSTYLNLVSPPYTTYNSYAPPESVDYGTELGLSAQVVGASATWCYSSETLCTGITTATGTITFSDNGKTLNTAVINADGAATYNPPFAVGSHSVAASYGGDNSYQASTASAIAFTVVKDTPAIYVGASNRTNDANAFGVVGGSGQPTAFTILIENGAQSGNPGRKVPVAAPTGSVSVTGFPSGVPTSGTLSAGLDPYTRAVMGIATITVPASTPIGTYTISISYSGDSNYAAVPTETGTIQILSAGLTASSTTASATGSISPTTSITVTGTVTGSGSKAPTGEVYAYSSGSFIAGAATVPATGDLSHFSVVLNSQNLLQGSNTVTLQYFGDSIYAPSAYTLGNPISNPLSDFTMVPASTLIPVKAGSSGTTAIHLASVNNFSGAVSLTCTAAAGVTCTIPASESLTGGGSASATLAVNAASATAAGSYNVTITGKDSTGKIVHSLGIQALVRAKSSFTLSNSGTVTLAHGATTGNTATIDITPAGGFTGTINLSCAVTTVPASVTSPVTCSVPPTVNITGAAAATAVLTIASTSTTTQGTYAIQVTGKDAATGKISSTSVQYLTVIGLPSTVNVSLSASAVTTGDTLQVAVTVTGTAGTPTGYVQLCGLQGGNCGNGLVMTYPLSSGAYTFTIAPGYLYAGTDTLTINYEGDATYAPESASAVVNVTKLAPTMTVTPSITSLFTNQDLTVSGTVTGTGTVPSGTVTVTSGAFSSGTYINYDNSYSVVVPPGSLSAGTDTLTVTYSGDQVYKTVTSSITVTVTQFVQIAPTITIVPTSTSVDTGANLTVNGTVTGTGGTPTGTLTVSGGGYTTGSFQFWNGSYSITIPPNSLSVGTDTLTASYSGDSTYTAGTATASITVVQSGFALAASTPASISPGNATASTITVSTTTGYTGTVTLTCALTTSPSGAAYLPTCADGANPVSLDSGTTSGTSAVTVSTTAPTTGALAYPRIDGRGRGWAGAGGGAILALLVFLGIPARRRSWRSMLGMLVLMGVLGSLAACGGGSNGGGGGGGGGSAGTTLGTYTFTVTATGSPVQSTGNTTTFTVTVN